MAAETDKFIIASSALWAGDFHYFESLLRAYSKSFNAGSIYDGAESAEDFLRATASLRLRQLWQKRGEFKKLALESTAQGPKITDTPIIMELKHLRATLWRTGAREFVLQGYLTDLSWQERLFNNAHRSADAAVQTAGIAQATRSDTTTATRLLGEEVGRESFKGRGAAWIVAGNPFIQVELTDLGLVEATGIWTGRELPDAADKIILPFMRLLKELDIEDQFS